MNAFVSFKSFSPHPLIAEKRQKMDSPFLEPKAFSFTVWHLKQEKRGLQYHPSANYDSSQTTYDTNGKPIFAELQNS